MAVNVQERERLLAALPFLRVLEASDLAELAAACQVRHLSRDEFLFRDGEPARHAYAVISGRIAVIKLSPEGKEQIIRVWGEGHLLGEVPLFGSGRYPAAAQALEPTRVLTLPRDPLLTLARRQPELALELLRLLAGRLEHLVRLVEDLSLREVPARLAAYLLELSARQGDATIVSLEVTKGRLSAILGTVPETLSRALGRLTREGLLEREGHTGLHLLDRERLRLLADGEWRPDRTPGPGDG